MLKARTSNANEFMDCNRLISPWCFQTLDLPRHYNISKLRSLFLLRDNTLDDSQLGQDFITNFIPPSISSSCRTSKIWKIRLYENLNNSWLEICYQAFTLLLYDLVHCAYSVLSAADLSQSAPDGSSHTPCEYPIRIQSYRRPASVEPTTIKVLAGISPSNPRTDADEPSKVQ